MTTYVLIMYFSVSSNCVGLFGPVDAIDKLCRHEVAQVLHAVGCSVYVVVATFSVVAEAMCVLHAQVQALETQQPHGRYREACFGK